MIVMVYMYTFLKSLNRSLLNKSRKRCGGLARNWFEDVNPP